MEHITPNPDIRPSFLSRNALSIKGIVILVLSGFLCIPSAMVSSLIQERSQRRDMAMQEVSQKWGGTQTLTGPILVIPYQVIEKDAKGNEVNRQNQQLFILPESLDIQSTAVPQTKKRSIFEFVLYNAEWTANGKFRLPDITQYTGANAVVDWKNASILMGISDLKGLEEQPLLELNGESLSFEPGFPDYVQFGLRGIHKRISLAPEQQEIDFKLKVKAKGSGSLHFTPIGKTTKVHLQSQWASPKFNGNFLPDSSNITTSGFTSDWTVLHMNRSYPQAFNKDYSSELQASSFGVDFITTVDNYTKSERSVKYAFMFICLTFLVVFFLEIKQKASVHPFHYALIGLALVIFYTLLVSISEHTSFNTAYMIATLMIGGLVMYFVRLLFRSNRAGALVGLNVGLLYGFLFVTLQSEDYALLLGSLGLFLILAIVMYFSGRIKLE
jgi:inner membrane protein